MSDDSRVIPCDEFRWRGVEVLPYKEEGRAPSRGVTRQTLLELTFVTRYFEIEPGGYSTLERHQHPHSVVILRGTGEALLGGARQPVRPFDCVYVAPGAVHQFRATGAEPLGFLCIVDRERDRPEVVGA
jgi:quercetin dioxygenase-like cupin family protein